MRTQRQAVRWILLFAFGIMAGAAYAATPSGSGETPTAIVAAAKALAAKLQYREALAKLEGFSGTVAGDPALAEIEELIPKYYLSWCDESIKIKKYAETCDCLFRMGDKPKIFALDGEQGVREKLFLALLEWEKDLPKQPVAYAEVLAFSLRAVPLLADKGVPQHRRIFVGYLRCLADAKNDMELLVQVAKYRYHYDYPATEIPDDLKKKISNAVTSVLSKRSGGNPPEELLEFVTAALEATGDPAVVTQRDKLLFAMAQLYEKYHDIELAHLYYNGIVKSSTDTAMQDQAKKAIVALDAKQAQFEKAALLPEEITKDMLLKALPVPYVIKGSLIVRPGIKVTVEKGAYIRGGKIEVQDKASMDFAGTPDTPIVLCDVTLSSEWNGASRGIYSGTNVVLLRVNVVHTGGHGRMVSGGLGKRQMTLSQSHLIGPVGSSSQDLTPTMVYSLKNCTFTNYKLRGELGNRDRDLVLNSLTLVN